jgi:hypothetical protein
MRIPRSSLRITAVALFPLLAACGGGGTPGAASTGAGQGGASTATAATGSGDASTTGSSGGAASTTSSATTSASTTTASASASTTGSGMSDPAQICVDTINMYRATLNLPPYQRWSANEACATGQAQGDAAVNTPHANAFTCGENAQNECPGYKAGPLEMAIVKCLAQMWAEGPSQMINHYEVMASMKYTKVACGFYVLPDGKMWATQDFK